MLIVNLICLNVLVFIVWFQTDAFIEYCRRIPILKKKIYDPYYEAHMQDFSLDYVTYLKEKYYNTFFVKIITCPICCCIWLSFIEAILFLSLYQIPILTLCSLGVYLLFKKIL